MNADMYANMQELDFLESRELIKWKLLLKHAISRLGFLYRLTCPLMSLSTLGF